MGTSREPLRLAKDLKCHSTDSPRSKLNTSDTNPMTSIIVLHGAALKLQRFDAKADLAERLSEQSGRKRELGLVVL